jgi:hypothetical protein
VHRAVKAVDGWAGDSYVTYTETDGTVCVKARYQGKSQTDTDAMYADLKDWLAADPTEGSTVDASGSFVQLTSCDPGSSATLKGDDQSMAAIELLGLRLQVVSEAFKANASSTVAECSSNGMVDQLDLADLDPKADQAAVGKKVQAALTKAIQAC